MPNNHNSSHMKWRNALKPGDEEEIRKWIEASGLRRVARIISAVSNSQGVSGRAERPDVALLLEVARILIREPESSLHSAALQVAERFQSTRKPLISVESLTRKLERDFAKRRHSYLMYVRASDRQAELDEFKADGVQSAQHNRILDRLIQCAPSAIDLYDWVLQEVTDPGRAKLLKSMGRARFEKLFEDAYCRKLQGSKSGGSPA